MMRECLICGARKHVQSCQKIQLCTRCAGVLWDVLQPKLHPEQAQNAAVPEDTHSPEGKRTGVCAAAPEGAPAQQ